MQAEAIDVVARAIDRHGDVADMHTAQGSGAREYFATTLVGSTGSLPDSASGRSTQLWTSSARRLRATTSRRRTLPTRTVTSEPTTR
jgi:hypothetical protein